MYRILAFGLDLRTIQMFISILSKRYFHQISE